MGAGESNEAVRDEHARGVQRHGNLSCAGALDFRRRWSPIWGGTADPDKGRSGSSTLHYCRFHS